MCIGMCITMCVDFIITLNMIAVILFGFDIEIWLILALLCAPISFLKQMVSVIQLVLACQNLGTLDVIARSRQRYQHRTHTHTQ